MVPVETYRVVNFKFEIYLSTSAPGHYWVEINDEGDPFTIGHPSTKFPNLETAYKGILQWLTDNV